MATWINPVDSETDPDAPVTSNLGKRWDNNIVAFYEQDATSPVNTAEYHPYDKVTVGDGNDGLIWDYSVDGSSSSVQTPDFDPGYRYLLEWSNISRVSNFSISINAYDNSDALIQSAPGPSVTGGQYSTASREFLVDSYWRVASSLGGFVSDTPVKYVRFVADSPITSGKLYLRRRREFI